MEALAPLGSGDEPTLGKVIMLRLWGCPETDSSGVVKRRHQFKASVSKFSCVGRARRINDALAGEALLGRF